MAALIFFILISLWLYMSIWWVISLILKKNDIADVAWGFGFVFVAIVSLIHSGEGTLKGMLLVSMVTIWGTRLGLHIAARHKGKPEDKRYVAMAEKWKYKRLQSYTNVFLSQGFFLFLVSLPVSFFFYHNNPVITWYTYVGLAVWIIGFLFEVVGDYQLSAFIKNPANKGKIMRYGLWAYSRHPNYFGEVTLWWGLFLFSLPTNVWYLSILGPLTISFLIIKISGIPLLEKHYLGNPEYEAYKKTTSIFFPFPHK